MTARIPKRPVAGIAAALAVAALMAAMGAASPEDGVSRAVARADDVAPIAEASRVAAGDQVIVSSSEVTLGAPLPAADGLAALGADCMVVASLSRRPPDLADLDKKAGAALAAPQGSADAALAQGWLKPDQDRWVAGQVWIGPRETLADAYTGTAVGRSDSGSQWILTDKDGQQTAIELAPIELPSGRLVWLIQSRATAVECR